MTRLRPADPETRLPLLRVRAGEVPRRMLVVGDPGRAELVAGRLDGGRELGRNREYALFAGRHRDVDVGVISHGVGSAGAAVCFEELCRAGAERIIRAGTTGGMQPDVLDGALVIATAAVRDEGLTDHLVPPAFPAVADVDIVVALRAAAAAVTRDVVEGIVLSSDLFYPHEVLGSALSMWQRARVVAVEMECAALFVTTCLHGVAAGAILTVDGTPLAAGDDDMSGYDPRRAVVTATVEEMIGIALDALVAPGAA
ncbi:MAG: nucleoside phosphorylase [Ilumatobacteraceae bacterium]